MATTSIKQRFTSASMLMKIIYINIAVFIAIRLAAIVCILFNIDVQSIESVVALPHSFSLLAYRPWTAITYMFAHYDVLHILFNMLWLYWFGRIFLFSSTPKQMVVLYFYGGLAGGLLYILAYSYLPYFVGKSALLIGASASIMAIVVVAAIRHHDYNLRLLFIGNVQLKWIAIVTIAIDLLSVTDINSGGHIAHIGGAIMGAIYALALNRGTDITRHVNAAIDSIASLFSRDRVSKPRRVKKPKASKEPKKSAEKETPKATATADDTDNKADQAELDAILDKVKRSGYSGLTDEEKKRLFDVSKRIK